MLKFVFQGSRKFEALLIGIEYNVFLLLDEMRSFFRVDVLLLDAIY